METKRLYRVIVRTTTSVQPRGTCWQTEVLYCGYDRDEAERVYHASTPLDYWQGYGNRSRETRAQGKSVMVMA